MKATAIIQARFNANRLPGKVLLRVLDKTIIEYVIERVEKAETIEDIIVATTDNDSDLQIVDLINRIGIKLYRGNESDVLDRYYQAAKTFNVKHVARITADCPLIDPDIIDKVINRYSDSGADYCSNTREISFPDGEDVEVFSFNALSNAWTNARLLSEREHVTPFITKHPNMFKLESYESEVDLSSKRWTVDEGSDFKFIKSVIEGIYPNNPNFKMDDILKFLQKNPDLENINTGTDRNEGYQKSLREDREIKGN